MIGINELVLKSCEQNELKYLSKLHLSKYLSYSEKMIIDWIVEYTTKYSEAPNINRLSDKFSFLEYVAVPDYPLADIAESCQKFVKNRFFADFVNKHQKEIENNEIDSIAKIIDESDSLDMNDDSFVDHSDLYLEYFQEKLTLSFNERIFDNNTYMTRDNVVWFAGRPETYKTTLCQWLAYKQFLAGRNVLVITNETSIEAYAAKIDSFMFGIPLDNFFTNSFLEQEKTMIMKVKQLLSGYKGSIKYRKGFVNDVRSIKFFIENINPDIVFLDGVYLMGEKDGWTSYGKISSDIKQLSLDYKVPFVGPIHTNRANTDGIVTAEQIALSDSFLKDCDKMFGIYREDSNFDKVSINNLKDRQSKDHLPTFSLHVNKGLNMLQFDNYNSIIKEY